MDETIALYAEASPNWRMPFAARGRHILESFKNVKQQRHWRPWGCNFYELLVEVQEVWTYLTYSQNDHQPSLYARQALRNLQNVVR